MGMEAKNSRTRLKQSAPSCARSHSCPSTLRLERWATWALTSGYMRLLRNPFGAQPGHIAARAACPEPTRSGRCSRRGRADGCKARSELGVAGSSDRLIRGGWDLPAGEHVTPPPDRD